MRFRVLAVSTMLLVAPGSAGLAEETTRATDTTDTATPTTVVADQTAPPATDNPFLPENENLSNCLSALPPPDCGSASQGGAGQYLAFGAMLLGTGFIGWRIACGVRRRDRAMSPD